MKYNALHCLFLFPMKNTMYFSDFSNYHVNLSSYFNQIFIIFFSCSERCLLTLVKVVQLRENPDLVTLLLEVLDFSFSLEGSLSSKICRSVGRVLRSSADRLNLTLKPEAISIRGTRLLFRHITHIHTLRYRHKYNRILINFPELRFANIHSACCCFFQAEWLYGGENSAGIEIYEGSNSRHC